MQNNTAIEMNFSESDLQNLVLYRDGLMIVLNKPSGMPVHKGPGPYKPLEDYFDAFQYGMHNRPCLAHRLDRETSGCLVLGRHPKALRHLGDLFASHRIQKTYLAVVHGKPSEPSGMIDFPLAPQSQKKHLWHMTVDALTGKPAKTHYRVIQSSHTLTFLELIPETGRTHQLRVHTDRAGFPIVGDSLYYSTRSTERLSPFLHLHAYRISVPYHKNKEAISVTAPLPLHFINTLEEYGFALPTE